MTTLNSSRSDQNPLVGIARSVLGNRFGLLAVGASVLGIGAYSSWGWLVAAGIAPLLLSVAPCAAMCALRLCTMGGKKKTVGDVSNTTPGQLITNDKTKGDKDCC